ncbi:MAG: hypothetical protein Fur0025_33360 [Oscillatoriaceae cyanobacterium]
MSDNNESSSVGRAVGANGQKPLQNTGDHRFGQALPILIRLESTKDNPPNPRDDRGEDKGLAGLRTKALAA